MSTKFRVMMLGLRAVEGAQGGIESHVRDIAGGLMRGHAGTLNVEVVERARYVPATRALRGGLELLQLKAIWSPKAASLETIVHTFLGVLWAGLRRPDLLHIHGIGPALMTPLARLLGVRVVVTHHGEDYAREKWGRFARAMLRTGEWCAARFANARIVIAPQLDKKLLAQHGAAFEYVPNAVPDFRRTASTAALQQWGLVPQRYIVHVGRIVPEKRQLDLIAAFAACRHEHWRLVLVGANDHPSDYESKVRAAAAATPGVVMTGLQGAQTITELLSHAALFALPSSHEGLPISLLEAMSCGARVMVSDLPTLLGLNLPQECYVRCGDQAQIAGVFQALIDSPSAADAQMDWGQWLSQFRIENIAARTVGVYRQALVLQPAAAVSD